MQVSFGKKESKEVQDENIAPSQDEKPIALSAFLTPPSRLIRFNAKNESAILTPQQISQKVASLLKPGPPFYSEVSSADLIENLSNASLMRCDALRKQAEKEAQQKPNKGWFKNVTSLTQDSKEGEEEQQTPWTGVGTVWSALDSLPSGITAFALPAISADGKVINATSSEKTDQDDDGLWSSIMFSCDLEGKNVELTKSCVIPTHVLNANHYFNGNRSALFASIGAGTTYKWDDWSNEPQGNVSLSSLLALYTTPTIEAWQWPSWVPFLGKKDDDEKNDKNAGGSDGKPTPDQSKGLKRVWVPSTTKVSVRANWWGYTIYIPQSVFPDLDADVEQAEKIANLIHTVLTTILDKASSLPIPAALQAAILVLKAIAPSTSYISTFIGWSWDEIKSFNKGQGVELSATWLLPIALIPHTWDAAIAPADQNGDGKPDGPPISQPPASEEPQKGGDENQPTPATPVPQPPKEGSQQPSKPNPSESQPENPTPSTPAPAEPAPAEPKPKDPEPEQPKPEEPKPEEPKTEEPQPEKPKPEEPKTEEPKTEEPKTEEPKTEEPKTEEPKTEEPKTEEPKTEEPKTEDPKPEKQKPEEPKPEEPKQEEPKTEEPATKEPAANPEPTPAEQPQEDVTLPETPAPAPEVPDDEHYISGDPLGRGKSGLPAIGDAPSESPAAENDGIEWQGQPAETPAQAPEPSTPVKSASFADSTAAATAQTNVNEAKNEKIKSGKRKLFGKISNRV